MITETRTIMGMPVTVQLCDKAATQQDLDAAFDYFTYVDQTFSTFKDTSEITKINRGLVNKDDWSADMKEVFELSEKTKQETDGYFNISNNEGKYDPSGLVKGWAIYNAALLLKKRGLENFYVEAGGDIQVFGLPAQTGKNSEGKAWSVGIKNPFKPTEIIKTVYLNNNEGVATSGLYERGAHIYNPKNREQQLVDIVSLTVIGKNVYEADRFATAAFAMQIEGIHFIEKQTGLEGYAVNKEGIATMTTGFQPYTHA